MVTSRSLATSNHLGFGRRCSAARWLAIWLLGAGVISSLPPCGAQEGTSGPAVHGQRRVPGQVPAGDSHLPVAQLTQATVERSLELGRIYLLANQTREGRFRYELNLQDGTTSGRDGEVRQAGALWGLACLHAHDPREATREGLRRGLRFFAACSRGDADGRRYVVYPQSAQCSTGTQALAILALLELLAAEPDQVTIEDRELLRGWLQHLKALERHDHRFYKHYDPSTGQGWDLPSPYFDGESLLAMARAARLLEDSDLRKSAVDAAGSMWEAYVDQALQADEDSDVTKGFFQWGLMSLLEMHAADWGELDRFRDRGVDLGLWMVRVHRVNERRANTAYAHEGLAAAWVLAVAAGRAADANLLADAIRQGLGRLTTWQVDGPLPHPWLREQTQVAPFARGGILQSIGDPWLRIDVTQHQMHALILYQEHLLPAVP